MNFQKFLMKKLLTETTPLLLQNASKLPYNYSRVKTKKIARGNTYLGTPLQGRGKGGIEERVNERNGYGPPTFSSEFTPMFKIIDGFTLNHFSEVLPFGI